VPEEERIDTGAIYTQLSLDTLKKEVPELDWSAYFEEVLSDDVDYNLDERIVSYSMPYFKRLGPVLAATDKRYVRT
jgi:hypothetical protein